MFIFSVRVVLEIVPSGINLCNRKQKTSYRGLITRVEHSYFMGYGYTVTTLDIYDILYYIVIMLCMLLS